MIKFEAGDKVLLVDSRGRRYLFTLKAGGAFHFHRGIVDHDLILGRPDGSVVRSTGGEKVVAVRPTLSDFVLKMPRGAQVVYPKDIGAILVAGDIHPGATVLEAGAGSGALTIALLRAVGREGRVVTYEVREDFASVARANVESFLGKVENLEIKLASAYEGLAEREVDRIVLDLPEPWRVVAHAAIALRPGGIFVTYLPTILQAHQLTETLREDKGWMGVYTSETLVRTWHLEGRSVRPDHRMVAHTGFITVARRTEGLA